MRERRLERETGIEPATNSLEGCDSTTELLPPPRLAPCRFFAASTYALCASVDKTAGKPPLKTLNPLTGLPTEARALLPGASEGWRGGEGSNLRSPLGGRFTVCCD